VQLIGHPLFVVTPMILLYRNFRKGPAAAAV
jgi:hypothetical protein